MKHNLTVKSSNNHVIIGENGITTITISNDDGKFGHASK